MFPVDFFEFGRMCAALVMLGVAAALDMRSRQVDDRLWMVFAAVAAALYFFDFASLDPVAVALSVGLGGGAGYLLYRTGLFGGADALALAVLSAILPTYDGRFVIAAAVAAGGNAPLVHSIVPLIVLSNAILLSLVRVFANVARNAQYSFRHPAGLFAGLEQESAGRKALAVMLGHRSDGSGFGFLMETREGKGSTRRFDFTLKNAEETPFESRKGVWVMPGIPFLLYMLAGLAAMIFVGDLAYMLISSTAAAAGGLLPQ